MSGNKLGRLASFLWSAGVLHRLGGRAAAVWRWKKAFDADPRLANDVARLGGVFAIPARRWEQGVEMPDPIDPIRMAKEQGRREMALEILALMKVGDHELTDMMEERHAPND